MITSTKKTAGITSPYQFEGRIPLKQAIPLGIQHVLSMFVGNLTPLMIILRLPLLKYKYF